MKLGISTASYFPNKYPEDCIVPIAKAGADICEIFFSSRCEYTNEFAQILKEKIDLAKTFNDKFYVHSIHSMTNQFEPDLFGVKRAHDDAIETYNNILNVGQQIDAKYYTFHGPTIAKRAVQYVFDYDILAQKFTKIYDIAQNYGIKLCYENVHWTYFHKPEYFEFLAKKCKNIGSVLDIKQAMQSKYDYKEYLKVMSNTLETVHVCDYNTNGITAIPGKGTFDFVELFKHLLDMDFKGGVLMEVYSKDYKDENELKDSFEYLKICLDKAKK